MAQEGGGPLGGDYYTKRRPDTAYMLQMEEENKRLRSEILKKNGVLLDTDTAYKKMIALLENNEELAKEQVDLIKLQRPLGKTSDMSFTLPVGSKLIHINFISGNMDEASILPANTNLDFPFSKLYTLVIANDGPATIVYSTNEPKNSFKANAKLLPNESYEEHFNFPTFETLNIALEGGSTSPASVRIRGLA